MRGPPIRGPMQMFFKLGSAREPRCYASFDKKAPSGIGEGKERTFFLPFRNSKLETRNLRRSILARSNRIRLGEPVGFSDLAFLQVLNIVHVYKDQHWRSAQADKTKVGPTTKAQFQVKILKHIYTNPIKSLICINDRCFDFKWL